MGKIIINGRPLHELTPLEIVLATAANPRRQSDGVRTDYYRNADLLTAFGTADLLTATEIAAAFCNINAAKAWSDGFNALRAGEVLSWGSEHGMVVRLGACAEPTWRLLVRSQVFELIGAAGTSRQRAVRIHGLTGAEAKEAAKIWKRELGRRERERVRSVRSLRRSAEFFLNNIRLHAEGWKLPDQLAQFRIGQHDTFEAARELILDFFDSDRSLSEAHAVVKLLDRSLDAAMKARREGRAFPPAPIPTRPPVVPDEDYAMLGELNL